MATILKSDEMATNTLGSLLLSLLPKSGLTGYFDFSSGQYLLNGVSIPITDFLNVTRSSSAQGVDKNGNLITYPPNAPRFHMVDSVKKYGLASGDNMANYFLNSNTPATQTIVFNEGTNRRFFILVRATGTGSVSISGVGIDPFTVQGGSERVVKNTATSNTITVTVTGSLSYVQVSRVTTPYGLDPSRPVTTTAVTTKIQDVNVVNAYRLAEAFNSNGSGTVFIKTVRFDGGDNSLSPHLNNQIETFTGMPSISLGGYVSYVNAVNGNTGQLTIRKQKAGSLLEVSQAVTVPLQKTNIVAAALNKTQADVFMNGLFSKMQGETTEEVEPFISRLPSLPAVNSGAMSPNEIITNVIIYNKKMTDAEILEVYDIIK